jgi:hypothetical protein
MYILSGCDIVIAHFLSLIQYNEPLIGKVTFSVHIMLFLCGKANKQQNNIYCQGVTYLNIEINLMAS